MEVIVSRKWAFFLGKGNGFVFGLCTSLARNMAERKRKALSLKQKIDIIEAVESNPNKNRNAIAEEFKVPRTTLLNILREKAKCLRQFESGKHDISRKRDRRSSNDTVDKALLE